MVDEVPSCFHEVVGLNHDNRRRFPPQSHCCYTKGNLPSIKTIDQTNLSPTNYYRMQMVCGQNQFRNSGDGTKSSNHCITSLHNDTALALVVIEPDNKKDNKATNGSEYTIVGDTTNHQDLSLPK
jgi:hypothetical protein